MVAFQPRGGDLQRYEDCTIWDDRDWSCGGGFRTIFMRNGIVQRNDFAPSRDVYYVPKLAWKMAKLHILPLFSVRHAPLGPRPDPRA